MKYAHTETCNTKKAVRLASDIHWRNRKDGRADFDGQLEGISDQFTDFEELCVGITDCEGRSIGCIECEGLTFGTINCKGLAECEGDAGSG